MAHPQTPGKWNPEGFMRAPGWNNRHRRLTIGLYLGRRATKRARLFERRVAEGKAVPAKWLQRIKAWAIAPFRVTRSTFSAAVSR